MTISDIYCYPLKSAKAIRMGSADIEIMGIRNDRTVVAIDNNNKAITGREFPKLTSIVANVVDDMLQLSADNHNPLKTVLPTKKNSKVNFKLLRNNAEGILIDDQASNWLSEILGTTCRLVSIENNFRPIDPKRGGKDGDFVGYADASPIHLITEESLKVLNSKLEKKVTALHFRPNLVIKGGKAFGEDTWKTITINDCEFEVHHKCKRCIFSTIDPLTSRKNRDSEPLITLAKFRKERNEALTFGIYLVPRKTGNIQLGNIVSIE